MTLHEPSPDEDFESAAARPRAHPRGIVEPLRTRIMHIFFVFLQLGATTFGGMYAATQTLEKDLVDRSRWLTRNELKSLLVVSTLIPAPKFMSFGGLVGFKTGGWGGSFAAVSGLVLPAAMMVTAMVALIQPGLLRGPLAPLNSAIGIAVVGLLFGNAYDQIRKSQGRRRERLAGVLLAASVFASILAGAPLILVALLGFVLGAMLIREDAARPAEGVTQ